MSSEGWILLAGVLAPIVGSLIWWLVAIEQRMLSREEHDRLCQARTQKSDEKLDQILDRIDTAVESKAAKADLMAKHEENVRRFDEIMQSILESNRAASAERKEVSDALGELKTKVAVLGVRRRR